jgi:hypothetical protein
MRRRQIFSHLNARDNRAPVPSGAGMGAAAVETSSPVSREEEEAAAQIWTPATDPTAAPLVKKRGWPKGKKRKP